MIIRHPAYGKAGGNKIPSRVACGNSDTVNLLDDGILWACGLNGTGMLGIGSTEQKYWLTKTILPAEHKATTVACGNGHTAAVLDNGELWMCGYNNSGQLGIGNTANQLLLVKATLPFDCKVVSVACGRNATHCTAAVLDNGELWVCGNTVWVWGVSATKYVPVKVALPSGRKALSVACGGGHAILILDNGEAWTSGLNNSGQLGIGNTTNQYALVKAILPAGRKAMFAACGDDSSAIILDNGELLVCGKNGHGQLGIGNATNQSMFVKAALPAGRKPVSVAFSSDHMGLILDNGELWMCGLNCYGQLGIGNTTNQSSPVKAILPAGRKAVSVGCAYHHTVVILDNDEVMACGSNANGQLGIGNTATQYSFTKATKF